MSGLDRLVRPIADKITSFIINSNLLFGSVVTIEDEFKISFQRVPLSSR